MEKEGKEGSGLPETSTGLDISGLQLLALKRHLTFLTLSFISLGGCWEVYCNNASLHEIESARNRKRL